MSFVRLHQSTLPILVNLDLVERVWRNGADGALIKTIGHDSETFYVDESLEEIEVMVGIREPKSHKLGPL